MMKNKERYIIVFVILLSFFLPDIVAVLPKPMVILTSSTEINCIYYFSKILFLNITLYFCLFIWLKYRK